MSTLWSFQLNGYCDCLVSHGFPMCELVSVAYGTLWHKCCLLASSGKFLLLSSASNSYSKALCL